MREVHGHSGAVGVGSETSGCYPAPVPSSYREATASGAGVVLLSDTPRMPCYWSPSQPQGQIDPLRRHEARIGPDVDRTGFELHAGLSSTGCSRRCAHMGGRNPSARVASSCHRGLIDSPW